jgi:hypothetical protein
MARKQFLLRIDPELWKELERWAADDLRSVNAQVEWLLRDAMRRRKGSDRRSDDEVGDDAGDEVGDDADDEVGDDAGDEVGDVQPDAADRLAGRRP